MSPVISLPELPSSIPNNTSVATQKVHSELPDAASKPAPRRPAEKRQRTSPNPHVATAPLPGSTTTTITSLLASVQQSQATHNGGFEIRDDRNVQGLRTANNNTPSPTGQHSDNEWDQQRFLEAQFRQQQAQVQQQQQLQHHREQQQKEQQQREQQLREQQQREQQQRDQHQQQQMQHQQGMYLQPNGSGGLDSTIDFEVNDMKVRLIMM